MITKLRRRLLANQSRDGGLTLIEVVVAMMIFTVISVSVLYTMTMVLSVTRDSRNRQVAANLAAQEIDLARDVADVFNIGTYDHDVVLNGDTFTVTRNQEWVYSTGGAAACGAGSGALRYKFVEVEVVWNGMRAETGVTSETFINPNTRINDPAKGTMIISVTTRDGEGVSGVPITATGVGPALSATTDSDGCAFILGVNPGSYSVKISSPTGTTYVDAKGNTQPVSANPATVVAGSSASVGFQFDPAATIRATYHATGTIVPINMSTTLLSTRLPVVKDTATAASTNPRLLLAAPQPEGDSVVAGDAAACYANDPSRWTAYAAKGDGELPEPVLTEPTVTSDVLVPIIPVTITSMPTGGTSNRFLVAVSKDAPGNGQPGCITPQVLRFAAAPSSTMVIALPFGSWELHRSNVSGFTPSTSNRFTSGVTAGPGGTISGNTITLDPRGPA